ncbi:MAG: hypothetical protein R6U78_05720 [Bacteroidales bacterium]
MKTRTSNRPMKTMKPLRSLLLAFILISSGTLLFAQERISEEQRKAEVEEQIRIRKEVLEEQQKQMKEQMKEMQEQFKEREKEFAIMSRGDRETWSSAGGDIQFFSGFDQGSHSQLTLRKNFDGTTDTSSGNFDVDPDIRQFRCMINGAVKSGEIHILLEYPDGEVFKQLVINSSADISYSQSVSIKEGEESKYAGTWEYEIRAEDAEGLYMLQISTN